MTRKIIMVLFMLFALTACGDKETANTPSGDISPTLPPVTDSPNSNNDSPSVTNTPTNDNDTPPIAALNIEEAPVSDFEYSHNVELGGMEITNYIGTSKNVRIPAEIDGQSVVSIGDYAFRENNGIENIILPDRIINIGFVAFSRCENLIGINIPNGVTDIGQHAFSYCTSLTSITIPGSVTSISLQAFAGCTNLQSLTIEHGVTDIDGWAFQDCERLETVIIPNSVTAIGSGAFIRCSGLTSITIPDSVTLAFDVIDPEKVAVLIYNFNIPENGTPPNSPWENHIADMGWFYTVSDDYIVIFNDASNTSNMQQYTLINYVDGVCVSYCRKDVYTDPTGRAGSAILPGHTGIILLPELGVVYQDVETVENAGGNIGQTRSQFLQHIEDYAYLTPNVLYYDSLTGSLIDY